MRAHDESTEKTRAPATRRPRPADANPERAILALQRVAGNAAVAGLLADQDQNPTVHSVLNGSGRPLVRHTAPQQARTGDTVQRYRDEQVGQKTFRVSQNDMYLLPSDPTKSAEIWVRSDAADPRYCTKTESRAIKFAEKRYSRWVPKTTFRHDCLRAAEDVMHEMALAKDQTASQVAGTGAPFSATDEREDNVALATGYAAKRQADRAAEIAAGAEPNDLEAPERGQAFAIVETRYKSREEETDEGELVDVRVPDNDDLEYPYHAAAVVAVDGGDRITLEALATSIDAEDLQPGPGAFHIYDTAWDTEAPDTFHRRWQRHFSAGAITITLEAHGTGLKAEPRPTA